jgi:hypothetical protein
MSETKAGDASRRRQDSREAQASEERPGDKVDARSSLPALDVTAEAYLKVHAINEAMEHATHTILELAENPVFNRGVLQKAAFQFRELLSRLNAALCTQLCDRELEQSVRIDRWISPGKYRDKD